MSKIEIYTDGSCRGNGTKDATGGYGVVVLKDGKIHEAFRTPSTNTTNNREELKAILYSFLWYGVKEGELATVYSDSSYCVNTFTNWMFNWESNGWKTSSKKTPENMDLIKAFYDWHQKGFRINIKKIKGHDGNIWNELADKLATGTITSEEVKEQYGKYY